MSYLSLTDLRKVYPNGFEALKGINIEIDRGEFIVFLGPSGCGKTTTLRMIAGLETVSEGKIVLEDQLLNDKAPKDRNISMIFQSYAVWPHMTVYENIAYPLKLRKYPKAKIDETVKRVAKECEIETNLKRYPTQLSGGQRQRVAVARAIAVPSKLFLMDEPLSNLDAKLRESVRTFLKQVHTEYQATSIFVTHDQAEAMALADRIVVMNKGIIEQIGTPDEIYNDCDSIFVATFMGTPPANVNDMEVVEKNGELFCVSEQFELAITEKLQESMKSYVGKTVTAAMRPEYILVDDTASTGYPLTETKIEIVEPQGSHNILAVKLNGKMYKVMTPGNQKFRSGENVSLSVLPDRIMYFDKETGKRIR